MSHSLYIVSLSLFIFASFGYLLDMKVTRFFNAFALTLFALATICVSFYAGHMYVNHSLNTILLLVSLTAIISFIFIRYFKIEALASFVSPFAALTLMLIPLFETSKLSQTMHLGSAAKSATLYSHIILAVLGQTLAIIAACVAALYIIQFKSLKSRKFSAFLNNLPGLDKLSSIMKLSLNVGFLLLSLALITGVIYAQVFWKTDSAELLPKLLWAIFVWLWYLICLWLAQVIKVKNLTLSKMSLIGFALLVFGYFGLFNNLGIWN